MKKLFLLIGFTCLSTTAFAGPKRAFDLVNEFGVNVHVSQGTAHYGDISNIISHLSYLGFWNVRDAYNPWWENYQQSYSALSKIGVKWDIINAVGGNQSSLTISSSLATGTDAVGLDSLVTDCGFNCIYAIEGPNEINNFALTCGTETGLQAGLDYQKTLYSDVKSDKNLKGSYVFYFTGYNAGSIGTGPDPIAIGGYADYDNQHPYPDAANPPLNWVNRTTALGNTTNKSEPAVYTETGYSTPNTTPIEKQSYTLDLLMDDANAGISKTYLYQLEDEGDGFGLFDTEDNPTFTAIDIHNFTTILNDPGSNAKTFSTVASPSVTIKNGPTNIGKFVVQKSNGEYDIIVWADPTTSSVSNTNITINISYAMNAEIYDPTIGTNVISSIQNTKSIPLILNDHPILVSLTSSKSSSN